MTPEDRWNLALDELEATLDRQVVHLAALVAGASEPAPATDSFVAATADLPPMPPSCDERARALLERIEELSASARARSKALQIRPQRPVARAQRPSGSRPSSFVGFA